MKERPIICRDDEVRAFIEGRKTQLRRPLAGPDTSDIRFDAESSEWYCEAGLWHGRCPFGVAGDRLWVREAWNMRGLMFGKPAAFAKYASKQAFHYRATDDGKWRLEWGGWRSAGQMVRNASRITLEITNVRVERLQDITTSDAHAEGFADVAFFRSSWNAVHGGIDPTTKNQRQTAWEPNPFVWVIGVEVRT